MRYHDMIILYIYIYIYIYIFIFLGGDGLFNLKVLLAILKACACWNRRVPHSQTTVRWSAPLVSTSARQAPPARLFPIIKVYARTTINLMEAIEYYSIALTQLNNQVCVRTTIDWADYL